MPGSTFHRQIRVFVSHMANLPATHAPTPEGAADRWMGPLTLSMSKGERA